MEQKDACPVCKSSFVSIFLSRKNVPVQQNFIIDDKESAISTIRGDLDLAVCESCGFIFNQSFDLSKMKYGQHYDNTQDYSPYFESYISNLTSSLIHKKNIQNRCIVEVGCGKGSFLRRLVENKEWGNNGYGFDPSYVGLESDLDGRLKFEKRYYDIECSNVPAGVVICRHVIEHIPDPLTLLQTIKKTLSHSANARVFFETPTVEWILHNKVIWDFFYEHCSYFTPESLATLFEVAGFEVENVEHVFNGQYLWLEAIVCHEKPLVTKNPRNIPILAKEFGKLEQIHKKEWEIKVQELSKKGKVAVWGAGAKGVTFTNMIDPECKYIECVIDLNPKKQGKYLVGTGHPIVSYRDIKTRNIKSAILMNPNYYDENLILLNKSNLHIDLIK